MIFDRIIEPSYIVLYTVYMKKILKDKAIKLRKEGYSYSYIQKVVGVSKSTLSNWLKDAPYTPNTQTIKTIGKARTASAVAKNKIKQESVLEASKLAKEDIGKLSKRDLFMLGLGIYIGEGSKSIVQIRVVNSDYRVIVLMIRWFHEVCNIPKTHMFIRIHTYPAVDEKELLTYWHNITGLSYSQFQKTYRDTRSNKKKYKEGTLPYGTAHLSIKSLGRKDLGILFTRRLLNWMEIVLR